MTRTKDVCLTLMQMTLTFDGEKTGPRAARLERWNTLMRVILPQMAKPNNWPIRLDHCFMRVCLDTALEGPWHLVVKRPAVQHLTDAQLNAAIEIGEDLVANPDLLAALNTQSIRCRKDLKRR